MGGEEPAVPLPLHADRRVVAEHDRTLFRDLSAKAIKRGSFYNVDDLIGAITEYINAHNADPKPFTWPASALQKAQPLTLRWMGA